MSATVLLLSDADMMDDVCELAREAPVRIVTLADVASAGAKFDEIKPEILLLAFMSIADAERCYLELYRTSQHIPATDHRCLLVCKAQDAELAYKLVQRRLFDDYVVIRPLHDPHRLALCLRSLIERREQQGRAGEMRQHVAGARDAAVGMNRLISRQLAASGKVAGDLAQASAHLDRRFAADMKALGEAMASTEYHTLLEVRDAEGLKQRLAGFAAERLGAGIATALEAPRQQLAHVTEEGRRDAASYAPVLTELDEWLANQPKSVLVVDDEPIYLQVLTHMLGQEGFEVTACTDPVEALTIACRTRPSAILVDFDMPALSGVDFVRQVRATPKLRNTPCMMITGHADPKTVRAAIAAGAADFIVKPGTRETIAGKLRAMLVKTDESHAKE